MRARGDPVKRGFIAAAMAAVFICAFFFGWGLRSHAVCGLFAALVVPILGFVAYWFAIVPILLVAFGIGYLVRFRLDQYANGTVALLLLGLILWIGYLLGPEFTPCAP
jgi:hypothetical protein